MSTSPSPAPPRLLEVLCWVFIPAAVLWLMVGVARDVGPAWDAAHGVGQAGTFTVEHSTCARTICAYFGPFSSTDGAIRLPDARMGEFGMRLENRQRLAVIHPPNAGALVYLAQGSRAWVIDTVLLGGFALALAGFTWFLMVERRQHRLVSTSQHRPGQDGTWHGLEPRQGHRAKGPPAGR